MSEAKIRAGGQARERVRVEPAFDHKGRRYCDGVKASGYWKGHPCNAFAKYPKGEYMFCGAHYADYSIKWPALPERPLPKSKSELQR